jgi:hypothetical protein
MGTKYNSMSGRSPKVVKSDDSEISTLDEGTGADKVISADTLMAQKVTEAGDITYIALAPTGTAQSAAAWRAYKVTVSGADTTITWADGDTNFDNVATDLTALSYS